MHHPDLLDIGELVPPCLSLLPQSLRHLLIHNTLSGFQLRKIDYRLEQSLLILTIFLQIVADVISEGIRYKFSIFYRQFSKWKHHLCNSLAIQLHFPEIKLKNQWRYQLFKLISPSFLNFFAKFQWFCAKSQTQQKFRFLCERKCLEHWPQNIQQRLLHVSITRISVSAEVEKSQAKFLVHFGYIFSDKRWQNLMEDRWALLQLVIERPFQFDQFFTWKQIQFLSSPQFLLNFVPYLPVSYLLMSRRQGNLNQLVQITSLDQFLTDCNIFITLACEIRFEMLF